MMAKDVLPGDVLTSGGTNFMVREITITHDAVTLRLAAGRTDPGFWAGPYDVDQDINLYRPKANQSLDSEVT